MNSLPTFTTFFQALSSYAPFPWQSMLAEQLAEGDWPKTIDLPTAAGKTACIDAAVYALAAQADKPVQERTAPRRIWFVVDRRIVVDEAYERACTIADKLAQATDGPLKEVADRLRQISGTERPFATARLRGGVLRGDGWARMPSQPAVITSTVDQLGSRLLFRGYGPSAQTAPIYAALAAHDSLILLDEAHLSVPFMQTLRAVSRYRGEAWAEEPIRTPFAYSILSATPPRDIPGDEVFPGARRDAALDHPVLRRRMNASKPAVLESLKARKSAGGNELEERAVDIASEYVKHHGKERVAVIVNRVDAAMTIQKRLEELWKDDCDVVLLTGRLRPYERDRLVERWHNLLRANAPEQPQRPIILVATQCIEVGADFSFDALVTEAASLDALRQRFGRLNRLGESEVSPATILVRESDLKSSADDFVYGGAVKATWDLLESLAETVETGKKSAPCVDFGITALDEQLAGIDDLTPYLAPTTDAPILMPGHIDLLCQTSPRPAADPDVQLYLHGAGRGAPEVRIVWRSDLPERATHLWREIVALCPPNSGESISVPLYRARRWLMRSQLDADYSDVEGERSPLEEAVPYSRRRHFLLWRGRGQDKSTVETSFRNVRPDDLIVVPATYGMAGLAQNAPSEALGTGQLDIWEPSHARADKPVSIRLNESVLAPWLESAPLAALVEQAGRPDWQSDELQDAINDVLEYASTEEEPRLPAWLIDYLRTARNGRIEQHPDKGLILVSRGKRARNEEQDLFADDDDLLSASNEEVSLVDHSVSVERAVARIAARCVTTDFHERLRVAGYWHDAGKLDERFQIWLHQGDELSAIGGVPLAKSAEIPASPARRRAIKNQSGLPDTFRHEMLSLQVARQYLMDPQAPDDLVLHTVASHHGYGRPFAPVCEDPDPPPVRGKHGGLDIDVSAEQRRESVPCHRLDSGVADRFWRLSRKYGWWGLAYLEAIVRLGDWYGSQWVFKDDGDSLESLPKHIGSDETAVRGEGTLALTGIDGTNPLGFLATVGLMVVLRDAGYPGVRLAWSRTGPARHPELLGLPTSDPKELSEIVAAGLHVSKADEKANDKRQEAEEALRVKNKAIKDKREALKKQGLKGKERQTAVEQEIAPLEREQTELRRHWLTLLRESVVKPEFAIGKNIDCTAEEYREIVEPLLGQTTSANRTSIDLLSAFCSTACLHESPNKRKDGKLAPTPFSFINGSGHQDFLATAGQLYERVTAARLQKTMFEPWQYNEEGLSMRWDPVEDRRYALMDRDPTAADNKPRTVWMANLLAYCSLVLFQSAPSGNRLHTGGWMQRNGEDPAFTWPLWHTPVGLDTIGSLLANPELSRAEPDRRVLREMGVVEVFRARRIKVGSGANFKLNFSPARQI